MSSDLAPQALETRTTNASPKSAPTSSLILLTRRTRLLCPGLSKVEIHSRHVLASETVFAVVAGDLVPQGADSFAGRLEQLPGAGFSGMPGPDVERIGATAELIVGPRSRLAVGQCTFPWGVRAVLGYDRELCRVAASAFAKELSRSLKHRAKRELGLLSVNEALTVLVVVVRRTHGAIRLNVHLTCFRSGRRLRRGRAR